MHTPKGFGKRYFRLAAILAYAVAPSLHAIQVRTTALHDNLYPHEEEEEEEPPEPLVQNSRFCTTASTSSSHCNCHFRLRTQLLLKLVRHIPKCNCKCRFFSFRRTGTHPPKLSFFI